MGQLAPGFGTDPQKGKTLAPGFGTSTGVLPSPTQLTTTSARLAAGHLAGDDLENYMATNQGKWELLGKSGAQVLSEAVLGTVEAGSYLLDWEQTMNHLKGVDQDYSNWLADSMKKAKQSIAESTSVYQTSEAQEGFAPSDATWWAKNSPQTIGTALSLMIPAGGVAGVVSKIGRVAGLGEKGIELTRGIAAAVASRYAESTMEANGVYERSLNDLLNRGVPEFQAKEQAGQAASKVWNTNWVFAAQDFMQYSSLLKGMGSVAKGKSGFSIGELIKQTASEGAEEAGQFIVGEEAYGSAMGTNDYFGKGFNKRLMDYVHDPEFKSSVLLGAVGGAVFTGGAPLVRGAVKGGSSVASYVKDKAGELFKTGLAKERANYAGDSATSSSIDDETFAKQAAIHMERGTLPTLKNDYEALSKQPDATPEAHNTIKQKIEDIDFIIDEQARLKSDPRIPVEAHNEIIFTKLDQRNQSRLHDSLVKEVNNLKQESFKNKELSESLSTLKDLQISAHAYKTLAKDNPQFAEKAQKAQEAYDTEHFMASQGNKDLDKSLVTSNDAQLYTKAAQLAAVNEKMHRNKEDLVRLTTPAGITSAQKKEQSRRAAEQAAQFVANEDVTSAQLREYLKSNNPQGPAQGIILSKLQEKAQAQQEGNQMTAFEALVRGNTTPTVEPTTPNDSEVPNFDSPPSPMSELEAMNQPPTNDVPVDDLEPYEPSPSDIPQEESSSSSIPPSAEEISKDVIERSAAEDTSPVIPQEAANEVQQKDQQAVNDAYANETVPGFLKLLAGSWNHGVFTVLYDGEGIPVEQKWNGPDGPVPVTSIFRTDASGQHLLIDTPALEVGTPVVLKVVDDGTTQDFPYTLTPGFRPDSKDNWVINVYLANDQGEAEGKPIMQMPSGDNKARSKEAGKLRELRRRVIDAPNRTYLSQVGDTNSIGEFIRTNKVKVLDVLRFDYFRNNLGKWQYGDTGHNPIIAQVVADKQISVPNIDGMKGMTEDTIKRIESFIDRKGGTNLSKGATYILRTNRQGNFQAALGVFRKINQQEFEWVRDNISRLIRENNLDQLREVINLRRHGAGIYKNENKDLIKLMYNEFDKLHLVQTAGQTNGELLIPYENGKSKFWLAVRSSGGGDQLQKMLKNESFQFESINNKGHRDFKHTSSLTPEQLKNVYTAFENAVKGYYKNISGRLLNSEIPYTDPVSNKTYDSYYQSLVETNTLATNLPGSKTLGKGQESSYSFHNARVGITVSPSEIKVEAKPTEIATPEEITLPPIEPVTKTGETGDIDYNRMWEEYEGDARLATPSEGYNHIGDKEIAWFNSAFGTDSLEVVKNVDRIYTKGGREAFGIYHNALVTLADFAEEGTLYHEAFHFALDLQATPKEKLVVLSGTDEETRAEEFRDYMLSNGVVRPKETKVTGFFSKLSRMIKNLIGMRSPIEALFEKFANVQLDEATRTRYEEARKNNPNLQAVREKARLLPRFPTYVAMNQAIGATSYEVLEAARAIGKAKDRTIFEVLSDEGQMRNIFQKVREKFNDDYKRILAIPPSQREREEGFRFGTYLMMGVPTEVDEADKKFLGSWDSVSTGLDAEPGFKQEVTKSFQKFGFTVRETADIEESDEELEEEEGFSETSREHIFDLEHTLIAPVKSLSTNIKMFLSQIPEPSLVNDQLKLDETGEPIIKRTIFGTPVMIDFNRVYNNLKVKLVGSPNPIARLGELAESDPISRVIYDALTKEIARGNDSLFQEFNTNLNLANYHQVTPLYGKNDRGDSEARLIATNQSSAIRVIKDKQWKTEAVRKSFIDMQGVVNQDKSKALLRQVKAVKEMDKPDFETLVKSFKHILKEIGVSVPEQVFEKLSKEKPERRLATIRKMFFGEQGRTLETFLNVGLGGVDPFEQTTVLNDLARMSKDYVDNRSGDTHLNEKMKQVNPINTPCYLTEFIDEINQDYTRARAKKDFFNQDLFFAGNKFVEQFTEKLSPSETEIDFISASRELNREAKDFGERGPADSYLIRFISYFNNSENSTRGKFFVTTFSDKTKQAVLSLSKHKGTGAYNFLHSVLTQTTKNEAARIQRNRRINSQPRAGVPLPSDIKPYNKRGDNFLYVPEANGIEGLTSSLTVGETSVEEMAKATTQLKDVVAKHISDQYNAFEQNLVENGVINRSQDGKITNNLIPTSIVKTDDTLPTFLREFFYNDYAWRTEVSKVIAGDKAFYKSDDDYNKRMYQLVTPGLKPYSDPTNPTVLTRMVYPSVFKTNSPAWGDSIKALIPKGQNKDVVDNYTRVNATDAQSLTTVRAYRSIRKAMGTWSAAQELVYEKAWKHNLTVNQAIKQYGYQEEEAKALRDALKKSAIQPLKPFQYNDRVLKYGEDTVLIKEQFKDSITPITPELAAKHQEYKKLLDYMTANKVDIASAEDTVKVGSYGVVDWNSPVQDWQKRRVSLKDLRIPQVIPDAHKEEVAGSQFWKLIDGDIEYEHDYMVDGEAMKGEKVVTELQKYRTQKLEQASDALKTKLGLGEGLTLSTERKLRGLQLSKIKTVLDNELLSRDLNENYEDAIRLVLKEVNRPDFTVHLGFPTHARKFESVLLNLFKKNVLKSKSPGFAMVNLADFNIGGQESSSNLNFITNKDGELVEAEIGMPIDFFTQIGLNIIENIDPQSGKIRWDSLSRDQQKALQMIVYRIPTSNKSSMLPVRVAMVIPSSSGNIVMVPAEITSQQGLDFDVDKSNILRRTLTDDGKVNRSDIDTKLFDLCWGVLTNKEHIVELLTPLAAPALVQKKADYQAIGIIETSSKFPVTTTSADVSTEERNKDSKAMIGIISRFNTAHSLLQKMVKASLVNVATSIRIAVADYRFNQVGRKLDSDGNLISNNYAQFQHQSLDNPKDPILSDLNVYTVTMPLVGYMTEMGVPIATITDFMMQPIVREWVQQFKVEGGKSQDRAFKALLLKRPDLMSRMDALEDTELHSIPPSDLKDWLTRPIDTNLDNQARILYDFKEYMGVASVAGKIANVLSIDTFGGMTDIESIESLTDSVTQVTNQDNSISLSPAVFNIQDAPAEIKSVAAFYSYGILDTVKFTSQFFPYMNQAYSMAKEELGRQLGNSRGVRDVDTLKKFNSFLDFYLLETKGLLKDALTKISPNYTSRWKFAPSDDPSMAIWNYVTNTVENHKVLKSNPLIQALENYPNRDKNKVQAIGISNTNKGDNKSRMIQGWRDMLYHPNQEIRTLAGDLVRYAIYSSGFGYTTKSFVDLVPSQFWVESGLGDAHESMVKGLLPLDAEGSTATRIDPGAITAFIRNKFEELDIVPEVYPKALTSVKRGPKEDGKVSTHITEFILPDNHKIVRGDDVTRWVKIKDRNAKKMRLYESAPNDPFKFKEVQPLGESRALTEVSLSGRDASRLPANQSDGVSPNPFATSFNLEEAVNEYSSDREALNHYLPTISNAPKDVLERLRDRETDPLAKEVIDEMLKNVGKISRTLIVKAPGVVGTVGGYVISANIEITVDKGNVSEAKISVSDLGFKDDQMRHVLLHELMHAYSIGVIRDPKGEREESFVRNLRRLHADYKSRFPDDYASTSPYEFIAELGSNTNTRNNVIKSPSLWARLIRLFRKLFGLKEQVGFDTLLSSLFDAVNGRDNLIGAKNISLNFESKGPDPSKKIDVFTQILSNFDAQKARLRSRGFKEEAKKIGREIEKLEAAQKNSRVNFVNRYLIKVTSEIDKLKTALDTLEATADPAKISPKVLYGMREQLISYDVLATLRDEVRKFPAVYTNSLAGADLTKFNTLMGDVRTAESRLRSLRLDRVAWKIKETVDTPMTVEEIRDQLEVADRDISWANYEMDPGSDVPDVALQAIHQLIKGAYAEGDRKTFDFLNNSEKKGVDVTYMEPEEFMTNNGDLAIHSVPRKFNYKAGSAIQVLERYEQWLKTQGIDSNSIVDKFTPILNTKTLGSETGVELTSPTSKEGKRIMALAETNPLRQFYENFVLGYLKSQESIPQHLRPGLRVPSIGRGLFESWLRESGKGKLSVFKEAFLNDLRKRYDEVDYKAVDEAGNPQNYLPVRFIARQDGRDGRLSTREVSLDIANTITAFINETSTRAELDKVIADSELIKGLLEEREVVDETQRQAGTGIAPLLMRNQRAAASPRGKLQTRKGINSYTYKMADRMLRRLAYGQFKKDEGSFKVFGQTIDARKFTDNVLRWTGLRIMLGNVAIPLTNLAMGEVALWKEAVGGNIVTKKQVAAGNRLWLGAAMESLRDLNNRQKQTKFGRFYTFFNPMDHSRPNQVSGIDSTWMRKTWENLTTSSPVEFKLAVTSMGAVLERFPVTDKEGKQVSFYKGVEVDENGKISLIPGFTYKGSKSISSKDVDEIRDYTLRLYEYMNGLYAKLSSPGMKESTVGSLLLFMRSWLRPGFRTRWELKRYDPKFKNHIEGHYISALVAFNNMFNPKTGYLAGTAKALRLLSWMGVEDPNHLLLPDELALSENERNAIISMRQANIRKTLFELYLMAGLSLLIFGAFGGDDDSYLKMMLARMRRETLTFLNPSTAWDVLRSPTVALRTVEDTGKILWHIVDAPADLLMDGKVDVYERGKNKGEAKWKADALKLVPIVGQLKQFDDIPTQTRLIIQGSR